MKVSLGSLASPGHQECLLSRDDLLSVSVESHADADYSLLNHDVLSQDINRKLIVDPGEHYRDLVDDPEDYTTTDLIGMINKAGSLAYSGEKVTLVIDHYSSLTQGLHHDSLIAVEDALIYLHRHAESSGVRLYVSNNNADMHLPYHPKTMIYVGGFNMLEDAIMIPRDFYARVYAAIRKSILIPDDIHRSQAVVVTDDVRVFNING